MSDKIIIPLSENALTLKKPFYSDSLITILPNYLRKFEENADDYMKKTFGFEITSSIKRIYYDRRNEMKK